MKVETSLFLAKALDDLHDAKIAAGVGLNSVAARLAYYAVFHIAEALIYERTGKAPKTHTGIRSECAKISRDDPKMEQGFSRLLAQFYVYKESADYAIGAPLVITAADVAQAISMASRSLEAMEALLRHEN